MKRVISYNLNGIRSAVSKGLDDWLKAADPDIVCFQETKAQPDQIPVELFEVVLIFTDNMLQHQNLCADILKCFK